MEPPYQSVTKKANATSAFLRRNIHQCPRETKALCYQTLVRPLTEYASVIWDPHTAENISKLEMIQRRAARMVFSDYRTTSSVSVMINQLNWPTLQERRAQAKATMMYRIVYQLIDIPSTLLPWYQPSLQGGITSPSLCRMPGLHSIRSLFSQTGSGSGTPYHLKLSAHHP